MKLPLTKKRSLYFTKALFGFTLLAAGTSLGFFTHMFLQKKLTQPSLPLSTSIASGQEALKNKNLSLAFKHYLTTLATTPHVKFLLQSIGQISSFAKQYDLAIAFLTVARTIDTNNPAITLALAQACVHNKQNDKAFVLLQSLAPIKQPFSQELFLQASRLFAEIGSLHEALFYAEKAVSINPHNPVAVANVGNMHNRLGDLDTAVTYYKKALSLKNDIPNIIYNLGYTIKRQGKLQEALPYFDRAIALKPGYLDAILDRAYTYWALGDFERAWQDYAWRFKSHGTDPTTTLPMPLWDGRDLKGKTILLYAEQGLGDTLQFIRLAESVKKRGNPTIICKVQKTLLKLLQSYPYVDTFVTTYETENIDYQAPLMSLPGILKLTPTTIPAQKTYLSANKKLVSNWQKKLNPSAYEACSSKPDSKEHLSNKHRTPEFRVGLCWHVDPIHEKDKSPVSRRSIALIDLLPLSTVQNISFYALQQGQGLEEINALPESFNLTAFDPYFDKRHGSFMDSAAVITNMDLVITVDTAIAHLAGALGKEVWMFLPFSPDGRWSHTTNKTPWYPTATLFRQTTPSDWKAPLHGMKKLLQHRVAEKKKILNSNKT